MRNAVTRGEWLEKTKTKAKLEIRKAENGKRSRARQRKMETNAFRQSEIWICITARVSCNDQHEPKVKHTSIVCVVTLEC